jgi:hypothetical protein
MTSGHRSTAALFYHHRIRIRIRIRIRRGVLRSRPLRWSAPLCQARLLCSCFVPALFLLCSCFVPALFLLCSCCAVPGFAKVGLGRGSYGAVPGFAKVGLGYSSQALFGPGPDRTKIRIVSAFSSPGSPDGKRGPLYHLSLPYLTAGRYCFS